MVTGPCFAPGWPAVDVGVGGLCYVEITVRTLAGDLHSGLFRGVAPNAHEVFARLIAELKTPTGRIRVPGLYEAVRRPGRRERQTWKRLPFRVSRFLREDVGARPGRRRPALRSIHLRGKEIGDQP